MQEIPLILFTIIIVLLSSGIRLFYYFIEWDEETFPSFLWNSQCISNPHGVFQHLLC